MNVPVKEETITSTMKKLFWKAYFSIGLTHLPEYRQGSWERVKGSLRHLLKSSLNKTGDIVFKKRGLLEAEMWEKYLVCDCMARSACVCACKPRVCRVDKGLSILSGYKETLLLAENNRHLVATSATIIKTDNFSTHHKQVIASSNAKIPLINQVLIHQLNYNGAVFGNIIIHIKYDDCRE